MTLNIDRSIKRRAAQIFEAYKTRRVRYIGPGKPGAFALLRDWFCDEKGAVLAGTRERGCRRAVDSAAR